MAKDTTTQPQTEEERAVARWTSRVRDAKSHWEDDFDRMYECERFLSGKQWKGQKKLHNEKYICNIVMQRVNQKVATLYARNPKAVALRRERLDYQVWDGRV